MVNKCVEHRKKWNK